MKLYSIFIIVLSMLMLGCSVHSLIMDSFQSSTVAYMFFASFGAFFIGYGIYKLCKN